MSLTPSSKRVAVRLSFFLALFILAILISSCGRNMYVQPKYTPLAPSNTKLAVSGGAARTPPAGTVSRKYSPNDQALLTGQGPNGLLNKPPMPVTKALLARGQQRYNIYCAPCHDYSGDGQGIIVQKGFPQPPSFHSQALRLAPLGLFFTTMTNGLGAMYSYASRVSPEDRWAIAVYIRALQLSQDAKLADIPAQERSKLGGP
jgi:mono/diheme cytochrome c family protein